MRKERGGTNPERLLAEKVGMSTPSPKTTRDESPLGIILGPLESCTDPFILVGLETIVFISLERILLIV